MGTIGYMSPEQVQGEKSDERSDLFSLGVVIYEMLSGKRPFEGENQAAILNGIINNSPPFLADINDKIPVKLIDIVEKLLDKDKNQRFQNARELIDALNDISGRNEIVQSIKDGTPSIAVLPFVNLSADPEQEYFCDGIAEEIINAITKVEKLKVVARTSAFAFKGKKADIRKIGKELNVGAILEGSVRKAGERIRITAQLIKVKDGFHLWSDRYDRTIKDVFAIQDEISLAIVEQLKVKLLGDEIQKVLVKRPENPEAHNLYLRGRHFWRMRSRRDLEKSIECFKSALEIEPEYARAYQGLAESYAVISSLDDNINANLAVENANKALSIDPTMGECHTTLAFDAMINFEFNHANELFDKAIEMTPRYSVAYHWASLCNCVLGNFDKMITQIDKAFDLDPLSVGLMGWRGLAQVYIGRPGKAVEFMEKNADFLKEIPMVSRSVCIAYLANNQLDEAEECLSSFDEFVEAHSKDSLAREAKSLKGLILAKRGQRKEARIILDELVKEIDKDSKVLMNCVKLGCELDMIDETLEWIKKAFEEKQFWMAMVVRYPDFDKLRKDSRYIDIMKNAGLKP